MSQAIFPVLPGLMWDVVKTPHWNTRVQQSVGGKEVRTQFYAAPLYRWQLKYELLRAASAQMELQALAGFFNARQGKFDSFLYSDPNDNTVTFHGFGAGDGVRTQFQLQRTLAGPRTLDWQGPVPTYTQQRTNYLLQSRNLAVSPWTQDTAGVTVTAGAGYSPDGTVSASNLIQTGTGNRYQQMTLAGLGVGSLPVGSIWLKANSSNPQVSLSIARQSGLDATSITVIPPAVWTRYQVARASAWTATPTAIVFGCYPINVGDAVLADAGQVEFGATATAFIPAGSGAVTAYPAYYPAAGDAFEPVMDLNRALTPLIVYKNGAALTEGVDYTVSASGLVTFAVAPGAPSQLAWTGSYYWRVRFDLDAADFKNFLYQLWDLQQLTLVSVK